MLVPIKKDSQNEVDLLTPKEAAAILRIGYRRVLDLIVLGEIRAHRIGHVFRISKIDLYRYLESTRFESPWTR